jgi:hypothetical protein
MQSLNMPLSSFLASNPGADMRLGDQLFRYDKAVTERAYAGITDDGATQCGCMYCRNFIAQRTTVYPTSFHALLDELGIDAAKEGEVYECGPADNGRRLYGGWLFFTGQMIERGERHVRRDGMEFWVDGGRKLPAPNGDFGLDLLALNFTMAIPWVLSEEP